MTTLNALGLFSQSDTLDEIKSILSRIENLDFAVHIVSGSWKDEHLGEETLPDVLFYEVDAGVDGDIEDAEKLISEYKSKLTVYIVCRNGDVSIVRRLMRVGAKDVFLYPVQTNELLQDVTNAITEKRVKVSTAVGGKGGIIGFVNAKGGAGATTLAVNLGHLLVTNYEAKTVVVDLDVQFGAVAHLLDLAARSTVLEALLQPDRIDSVYIKALVTKHESGLEVLASPSDLSPLGGITAGAVNKLIDTLSEEYEFVILDIPRILTGWTMAALKYSNPLMIVSQNSLATIRDTKLLLNRLTHEGVGHDDIEVINNRAMAKLGSVEIEKYKEAIGKERIHRIRNDYKTSIHAQDQGRPIVDVAKGSHFTKDMHALAKYFVGVHRGEVKKGFFSKLFS